jgi:hypothetical protein
MFDTTFDDVVNCINSWKPGSKLARETQYRDDLISHFRNELNKPSPYQFWPGKNYKIQKEKGRSLADIGINDKVGIELKYNMDSKAKADRLFGQIESYSKSYRARVPIFQSLGDKIVPLLGLCFYGFWKDHTDARAKYR